MPLMLFQRPRPDKAAIGPPYRPIAAPHGWDSRDAARQARFFRNERYIATLPPKDHASAWPHGLGRGGAVRQRIHAAAGGGTAGRDRGRARSPGPLHRSPGRGDAPPSGPWPGLHAAARAAAGPAGRGGAPGAGPAPRHRPAGGGRSGFLRHPAAAAGRAGACHAAVRRLRPQRPAAAGQAAADLPVRRQPGPWRRHRLPGFRRRLRGLSRAVHAGRGGARGPAGGAGGAGPVALDAERRRAGAEPLPGLAARPPEASHLALRASQTRMDFPEWAPPMQSLAAAS
ncbi:Uncharacterised protein [Roseomonas gilardii subsp. rosea]|nr:Uncharacterised protein [Roseomonas gilardii subsp. rosea]